MDHSAFAALAERHRRELHVHCYRMLASFDEAEDAVQETFLKAWRGRSGFDGGSQFRAWLYRIATNVCLDMLRRSSRRTSANSFAEVPWLQPYPDLLLDQAAPSDEQRMRGYRVAVRTRQMMQATAVGPLDWTEDAPEAPPVDD